MYAFAILYITNYSQLYLVCLQNKSILNFEFWILTKYELGIIVDYYCQQICKLIEVIVNILVINSHDIDIPQI